MGLWRGVKGGIQKAASANKAARQGMRDTVKVGLPGLMIEVERCSSDTYPHELTVVLPRVEVRKTEKRAGVEVTEEYVYSSLTVVHAPRHPLADEGNSAPPMDSRPALVYTLKRWPTSGGDCHPRRSGQPMEVDEKCPG